MVTGLVFCVGALIQCLANHKTGLGIMYAGRVIVGFCIGIASNLAVSNYSTFSARLLTPVLLKPIYISEVSPAAIRGRLIGLYELGWQIGAVVGFFINYVSLPSLNGVPAIQTFTSHELQGINKHIPQSNKQWIISFAVQLIPGGLLCIGTLFITESPRWRASHF